MTKVYIVAMPKVTNQDAFFQEYASKVAETLEPFDGKFLAVNPNKLIVEGDEPSVAVIGEFPNKEKALEWYNSDAYNNIVGHRRENTDSTSTFLLCEGLN
jgi:uncharacterized protein (DUF1330 family)